MGLYWYGDGHLFAGFFINRILKYYGRSFFDDKNLIHNQLLTTAFLSSVLLLMFSMGYPFKLVATVASICLAAMALRQKSRKPVPFFLALFLPVSFFVEGISYHREISRQIAQRPNYFNAGLLPTSLTSLIEFVNQGKYQAIIPLPFYDIGSENFGVNGTDTIHKTSMILSYHTRLPIMGNYATRTSIWESKNLVQLLAPSFYEKEISQDIRNDEPFLVLYTHESLTKYETALLDLCDSLFTTDRYSLYSISPQRLFSNSAPDEISRFQVIKGQLTAHDGFFMSPEDTGSVVIFNSFEEHHSAYTFRGSGACQGAMRSYNLLQDIDPSMLKEDTTYSLSFWMYNDGENFGQDAMNTSVFIQTEDDSGNAEWIAQINPAGSTVINGSWSLVELDFTLTKRPAKVLVYLKGSSRSKKTFYIDDLLLRQKDVDVYRIDRERDGEIVELFMNNHAIVMP